MRQNKIVFIVSFFIILTATNSFAGVVYVNCGSANGTINIDATNSGADRELSCNAPSGRHAIEYKVTQRRLMSSDFLRVSFVGASFNGGYVYVCSNTTPIKTLSAAIPDRGVTNYYFVINDFVNIGEYIYFTSDVCDGANNHSLKLFYKTDNFPGAGTIKILPLAWGTFPLAEESKAQVFSLTGSCNNNSFFPTVHNFDKAGGTKSFSIESYNSTAGNTTQCLWYASDVQERYWDSAANNYAYRTADWVTVNNWSGIGRGTISYSVGAYNNIGSRWARMVLFGDKYFYITQTGLTQSMLTVTKAGTGTGTVTANPGTITWNGNVGTAEYLQGTQVTLTATATGGSTFWGWTGDCSGSANTCSISLDSSKSVNAIFYSPTSTCNYNIEPMSKSFGKAGGTGKFSIKAPTDSQCTNQDEEWSLVSDSTGNWVQFAYDCNQNVCLSNTFSGRGSAVVSYKVSQNTNTTDRTSQISTSVSPQTYLVQQSATSCISCGISFSDVPTNFWARDYINAIACAGITVGCGNNIFCPNDYVTNAQFSAFLLRAMEGEPPDLYCYNGGGWFLDNPVGNVFCNYIRRLAELSILKECTNGYFCPNSFINRATIAEYVSKGLGHTLADNYCSSGSPFSDVGISHPQCKYIKKLYELGIITGCGSGKFCPNDLATRAEMAKFLYMAFLQQKCS